MRDLNRRLDGLEATLAPEGKCFMIWAMIDGRRMTKAEIDGAFQEAIASGRAKPGDRPLAMSWMVEASRYRLRWMGVPGTMEATQTRAVT
jgi:hypothetical protein